LTILDDKYEGSERYFFIRQVAGRLVRYNDPKVAESFARCINEARCKPPLSNEEIHDIVAELAQLHDEERQL
jgi:hypothetical protein